MSATTSAIEARSHHAQHVTHDVALERELKGHLGPLKLGSKFWKMKFYLMYVAAPG